MAGAPRLAETHLQSRLSIHLVCKTNSNNTFFPKSTLSPNVLYSKRDILNLASYSTASLTRRQHSIRF